MLLLALCLPATACCLLEKAGLVTECGTCDFDPKTKTCTDTCGIIDPAQIVKSQFQQLPPVVIPPDFFKILLLSIRLESKPFFVADSLPPLEHAKTWHIVHRMVLPARAPSVNS
jgi:hypothetical protein